MSFVLIFKVFYEKECYDKGREYHVYCFTRTKSHPKKKNGAFNIKSDQFGRT